MRPHLFGFHLLGWNIQIPTYGVMLALAFIAALWLAMRSARRMGLPRDPIMDLWIAALVSGIVGAKLLLYLLDLPYYLSNPMAILLGLRSAGVFYGGLLAGVGTCLFIVWRRGLPGWIIADIAAPSIALAQSIGRLGCFAAGCCYGKVTDVSWAVIFTSPEAQDITGVPLHVPLHPSQIYMAASNLLLFLVLLLIGCRKRYDGQVFLWYLLLYAVIRALLELTRGDPRGELLGYSTSQIIAAAAALAAGFMMWRRSRIPRLRADVGVAK